ncbi:MAG: DUF2189 domain-containing protein [Caldilineaceae bacterium]|nr:DUF2189 domain-containing protein [Caldilineaceae bacterium]
MSAPLVWLRAGWRDLMVNPTISLLYGLAIFVASVVVIVGLFALALDYILFPALAGFMVIGPLLAVGLYEKSRRIARGDRVTFASMVMVRPRAGGQALFAGALLGLLMLFWMRSAVILYALFFGLRPFPGVEEILPTLVTTQSGWLLLVVGTLVGGLFAAFSFAISAFSIPMLLDERVDAFTAMGTSVALVWHNLPVMLAWGAIVLALFVVSAITGLIGLILVFPLLGHATWHAYQAMRE